VAISYATSFIDDDEVIDLILANPLDPGDYVLTVAQTVRSTIGGALDAPYSITMTLVSVDHPPISLGASDSPDILGTLSGIRGAADDTANCENLLTQLINPAVRGKPNWQAVIAGLAKGDCEIRAQAAATFRQLFLASASGSFLQKRAADFGVSKPALTGMADEAFRQLAIAVINSKLTQSAFLDVLEVLYGPESVRAYFETGESAPFVLSDGATLRILIDEKLAVDVKFNRADFAILRRASAAEVAAVITRALSAAGSGAYAVAYRNPTTDLDHVRVFSGSAGLGSSVRVVSGTSAIALQPPSNIFPRPDSMPRLPIWVVETIGNDKVRITISDAGLYDLSDVEIGDYVTIGGLEFDATNRGSWVVEDVSVSYSGSVLTQYVEITNPVATDQTVTQSSYDSIGIFRATKRTQYDSPTFAAVSQSLGRSLVSIAATTQAVNRTEGTGAYLHKAADIVISTVLRDFDAVQINTSTAHGLAPGASFFVDGFQASLTPPSATAGVPATSFSSHSEAAGSTSSSEVTALSEDTVFKGADFKSLRDLDGDLWIIGGNTLASNGVPSPLDSASVFRVEDDLMAKSYRWTKGPITRKYQLGSAPVVLDSASRANNIHLCGGYTDGPWATPSGSLTQMTNTAGIVIKKYEGAVVLVAEQFSNTYGLLSSLALWFTSNPASGNLLTVKDGVTTRTYGFGTGGDVTVSIGADLYATQTNLVNAINGDGSASWVATDAADAFSVPAVVITEKQILATRSNLRVFGNSGLAGRTNVAAYADSLGVDTNYSVPKVNPLVSSDPGYGLSGPHIKVVDLQTGEIHKYLEGGFRSWTGSAWSAAVDWNSCSATGGTLGTGVADAAAAWMNTLIMLTGGVDQYNQAVSTIQEGAVTTWTTKAVGLKQARSQHHVVKLDSTHALVFGGRQPASAAGRSGLGFTSWLFEEMPASATTFAGPVTIGYGFNPRWPGKIGWGLGLSVAAATSTGGGSQTTLNTSLLGNWTIAGWMTAAQGTVLRNGVVTWATSADNTMIAFGVDPSDDKFFIRWQEGSGVVHTKKTADTRTVLMGPEVGAPYPRFHHFAITKTVSGSDATFALYINGTSAGSWTDTKPSGGASGLWSFGQADGAIARFQGCVDLVGFSSTVLTDDEIWQQYIDEVGVSHENPAGALISPVGRVLNSSEIVPTGATSLNPSVLVGSMTFARFGAGVVQLEDGRVLVLGGVGYNPSTDPFPHNKSQRELELRSVEIYSPDLKIWTSIGDMKEPHSYPAVGLIDGKVYISGGFSSKIVEYLDLATMKWHVAFGETSVERSRGGGGLAGNNSLVIAGGANKNEDGFYDTDTVGPLDYILVAGENEIYSGGINGLLVAADGTSGSTIYAKTPGRRLTSGTGGSLYAASAPAGGIKGPYVLDPQSGLGLTAANSATSSRYEAGRKYASLDIGTGEAGLFPDEPGFVVVSFGNNNQIGPIRYLGRLTSSSLAIDASFKWPSTVEVGADVRLLSGRSAWLPEDPETIGAFYITAAAAGRVAAQQLIGEISAAGIDLDITVRYPGDRGLGGEGYPSKANHKLSDIVEVFGGDDLDQEISALKEAE
jgi:hypothetical protein